MQCSGLCHEVLTWQHAFALHAGCMHCLYTQGKTQFEHPNWSVCFPAHAQSEIPLIQGLFERQQPLLFNTDRIEEDTNGVLGLELPPPEIKHLAQIAKVSCMHHNTMCVLYV